MSFFMNAPVGIYIIQNKKFFCFNPKFKEITGYTEEELQEKEPSELILSKDREQVRKNAILMLKGERKEPYSFRILDKSGDIRWIIESVTSIRYQENRAVLGNCMDITESEELRAAITSSPIGIYIIKDHRFFFSNARFQAITGYTEDELLNKHPLELVFLEDKQNVRKYAIQMLKGERIEPYQFRIIDKSGDIRWIIETVASVHYKGNRAVLGNFMDITETEDIRRSFMNSPIGIYMVQNRKFCFSNARFQEITGYTQEELLKKHPLEIVAPDDKARVKENALLMLKGKLTEPYQFRILNKSEEIRWIIETVASVHYQGTRAVIGNFMDITESKQTEAALQDSENKYRSLFELAREGIVMVNYADGNIIDANTEFQRQTGYDIESLKRKKIWDIQPSEFQYEARETFFRFRETRGGIVSWKLCQGKSGKVLPVEIVAQHILIKERNVIFCMVRDISEREAMMRALTQASEEWRRSFDALDDAMLVISPDFKIQRANLAAARLLRQDVRTIIGQPCHQLFHGTDTAPGYCPHLKAQSKGIYCEAEEEESHLGGGIFRFSSSPIKDDDTGKINMAVEIISDVTTRRKHERESVRLSTALAKSFKGITESLSDLAESRDPYTAGHSRHVAKLTVLVGKELGFSEEEIQGLHTCAILHDIGKAIIPAAILNKPGRLSEHEWGLIREHPTTAYEALHHIPFPWPVADVVYQHHERLDGSGYPKRIKGNQIHPWSRIIAVADVVDAMTSHRPYRPGLPRQNAVNELLKGRGTMYDAKAVDTLIRVLKVSDRRVLVIDEDSDALEGLLEALKIECLRARGFTEPKKALLAFEEKPFPLVITEMNMLEMDGLELTKAIKEIDYNTEVIVVTKYGSKEETLRALRAGASDFLEKPIDLEILRKSVNRALQRFMGKKH